MAFLWENETISSGLSHKSCGNFQQYFPVDVLYFNEIW